WHRTVGRTRERRAPVEPGHELGLAHILDVEDHESALPVAGIETVAHPQRGMAAVRGPLPARRLAAGDPLPPHPPAPAPLRPCRLLQFKNAEEVALIAFERGRAIEIAAVEIVAVHAGAGGLPARDLARL